jgi:hypothetical protein
MLSELSKPAGGTASLKKGHPNCRSQPESLLRAGLKPALLLPIGLSLEESLVRIVEPQIPLLPTRVSRDGELLDRPG